MLYMYEIECVFPGENVKADEISKQKFEQILYLNDARVYLTYLNELLLYSNEFLGRN